MVTSRHRNSYCSVHSECKPYHTYTVALSKCWLSKNRPLLWSDCDAEVLKQRTTHQSVNRTHLQPTQTHTHMRLLQTDGHREAAEMDWVLQQAVFGTQPQEKKQRARLHAGWIIASTCCGVEGHTERMKICVFIDHAATKETLFN